MSHADTADDEDVAGTVRVRTPGGGFDLPDPYAAAESLVYRDPSKTVDMASAAGIRRMWFDPRPDANPELAPDRITLKAYGEDAETYRVENPDDVDTDAVDGGESNE